MTSDDVNIGWDIFVIVLCLGISAFWSGSETALTSLSSLKTKHLQELHGRHGKLLDLWLYAPQRVLATILIGNTVVNVFSSIYVDHFLQNFKFGTLAATIIATTLLVFFGEILPKTLAKSYATQVAIPAMFIVQIFYKLLLPVTYIVSLFVKFISFLFIKKDAEKNPQITEEELEFLINVGEKEGVIQEQKHEMLSGVFELEDTFVREIMIHRMDVVALPLNATLEQAIHVMQSTGFSRIPVYEERIDNIVGFVHVKDILFHLRQCQNLDATCTMTVNALKREALFVPESKTVDAVFQEMRKLKQHIAIVVDEYGGTSGIVTIEDILEEIVGDMQDEFDNEEAMIRPGGEPETFCVEGKIHIEDFCDAFEITPEELLGSKDEPLEFDTLGGFILYRYGQIPKKGDIIEVGNFIFEVTDVSKRRVRRVLVRKTQKKLSDSQEASPDN